MEIKVRTNIVMKSRLTEDSGEVYSVIDENRPYLRKWLPWVDGTNSPADIEKTIASWEVKKEKGTDLVLGIFKDNHYVGNIGLHDMKAPNNSGMVGYWLAESEQGSGIVTDCVRELVKYGFAHCSSIGYTYTVRIKTARAEQFRSALGLSWKGYCKKVSTSMASIMIW